MKWKNLGFALVALLLPSWCLMGADGSTPTAQPAAWRTTQGPELPPDNGFRSTYWSSLPAGEATAWQAAEGSVLSPQRLPWAFWEPSWNAAGDALDLASGGPPFTPVPEALICVEGLSQGAETSSILWNEVQNGSGHVAPVSCAEPLTSPVDGLLPLPYSLSDPADGLVPLAQPFEEPDEMGFPPPDEFGDSAVDGPFVTCDVPPYRPVFAARFGWWFVEADGSPTKVAEYQGLGSSAFTDLDGLFSDGQRTVNLSGSFLDNETGQAGVDYFGPRLAADFDLQRYLHRLDHDPLTNMGDMQSGQETIREDLNVGEDYAIRVEDVKTSFEGRLSEHVKARLNFRSLRKIWRPPGQRHAALLLRNSAE